MHFTGIVLMLIASMLALLPAPANAAAEHDWGEPPRLNSEEAELVSDEHVAELVHKFMECDDPLADNSLMRDLVACGDRSFYAIMRRIPEVNGPQLDALLELAIHFRDLPKSIASSGPLSSLFGIAYGEGIVLRTDEDIADNLIGYCNDPRLGDYVGEICILLAKCGGKQAGQFLLDAYATDTSECTEPECPPFFMDKAFGQDNDNYVSEPVSLPNGDMLQAYVNSRLAGRVVCLMLDEGGDGSFDAWYPTELEDSFNWGSERGESRDPANVPRRLGLQVDNRSMSGRLRISHHTYPRSGHVESAGISPDGGLDYVESTVHWTDIVRDSDRDGLTDILESYMFTDPYSSDTDQDGLDDLHDRYPTADLSEGAALSRGLTRLNDGPRGSQSFSAVMAAGESGKPPFGLRYILCRNCEPFPVSPQDNRRVILIDKEVMPSDPFWAGNSGSGTWISSFEVFSVADFLREIGRETETLLSEHARYVVHYGNIRSTFQELIEIDGELFPGSVLIEILP